MTLFWRLWWASLAIKLLLAAILPLAADEAYYWFWSHHLQLSYFDHPPVVALLFWLGQPLENWLSLVRWPGVILAHSTLLIWYFILREKLNSSQLIVWLFLSLLTPLIGFGSLIITPDIPLLFFWGLAVFCFEKALGEQSPRWYVGLGISLGLGFCSKYHIVLLVPFLIIALLLHAHRKNLILKYLPLTFIFGLACSLPVLIWNAQNDWSSFRFQLEHGLGRANWSPEWTISYILSQGLFFSPLLMFSFFRGLKSKELRTHSVLSISTWIFFLYSSTKSVVEGNWPIIGYSSAYAVAANGGVSKKNLWLTCGFWILMATVLASHWLLPWLPANERLDETHQYRSLAGLNKKYSPLYANTYQMASLLSFELKTDIPKLRGMSRKDFYDGLSISQPTSSPFFLIKREGQSLPFWTDNTYTNEVIEKIPPNFELLRMTKK